MSNFIVPSSPTDRETIEKAIKEIVDSKTRKAAEDDRISDIKADLKEQFNMPASLAEKMANNYFKDDFKKVSEEFDDYCGIYSIIMEG